MVSAQLCLFFFCLTVFSICILLKIHVFFFNLFNRGLFLSSLGVVLPLLLRNYSCDLSFSLFGLSLAYFLLVICLTDWSFFVCFFLLYLSTNI